MSKKSNPTTLGNLLGIAASNAAAREAAAKKAAAEQAEAEQAEAEAATDKAFGIIADVTGATKDAGGFPAVTTFMGRLADYAITGVPASIAPPGTSSDPALVTERDGLRTQVTDLTSQLDTAKATKDSAEAAKVTAEGALASANTANSNLQTQLDTAVAAKDSAEAELANERNPRHANSLAQQLAAAQAELTTAQTGMVAVKAKVDELGELDLTKTTLRGDAVKVPLETAEKINSVRSDLRAMFRL